jgi:hypothetical protein
MGRMDFMMNVENRDGTFTIDGADLGQLLQLAPEDVRRLMREGALTCRVERGEGEHDGRFRLTFFHDGRRAQLIVDRGGAILRRSRLMRADAFLARRNRGCAIGGAG